MRYIKICVFYYHLVIRTSINLYSSYRIVVNMNDMYVKYERDISKVLEFGAEQGFSEIESDGDTTRFKIGKYKIVAPTDSIRDLIGTKRKRSDYNTIGNLTGFNNLPWARKSENTSYNRGSYTGESSNGPSTGSSAIDDIYEQKYKQNILSR